MRLLRVAALALALPLAAPLAAQGASALGAARAAGQVGERFDGYLGIAGEAGQAARQQLAAVNIKRRALYSNLGSRRQVAPEAVAITAGCELLARVAVGEVFLLPDGKWHRRDPGEAPPSPPHCGR